MDALWLYHGGGKKADLTAATDRTETENLCLSNAKG